MRTILLAANKKRQWLTQAKPPTNGAREVERRRKQLEKRGAVPPKGV